MPRSAVCSWSLRPSGPEDLASKVRSCGLAAVQLALDPIRRGDWEEARTITTLRDSGITAISGMIAMEGEDYSTLESIRATGGVRPDRTWERNLSAAGAGAALARRLGIGLVTFHAGFLPHDDRALRQTMVLRLREIAAIFSASGVRIALETGQESAETLIGVLNDLGKPQVWVNFDPANMILYGMGDPVAALKRLAPWVRQVHVKDALASPRPGVWGTETPVGKGAVDWPAFFDTLRKEDVSADLVIERESGDDRIGDIAAARALIDRLAPTDSPGPTAS